MSESDFPLAVDDASRDHGDDTNQQDQHLQQQHDDSRGPDNDNRFRLVFLGNLIPNMDEQQIRDFLATGNITVLDERAAIDIKSGYAFVKCVNDESLANNVASLNRTTIAGHENRPLTVEFTKTSSSELKRREARQKKATKATDCLFVVGFDPAKTKKRDLENEFGAVARIKNLEVLKTYAYVYFDAVDDAVQARDRLNGADFMGKILTIEFRTAPPLRSSQSSTRRDRDRQRSPPAYGRGGAGNGSAVGGRPDSYREQFSRYDDDYQRMLPPPPSRYDDYDSRYDSRSGPADHHHYDPRRGDSRDRRYLRQPLPLSAPPRDYYPEYDDRRSLYPPDRVPRVAYRSRSRSRDRRPYPPPSLAPLPSARLPRERDYPPLSDRDFVDGGYPSRGSGGGAVNGGRTGIEGRSGYAVSAAPPPPMRRESPRDSHRRSSSRSPSPEDAY